VDYQEKFGYQDLIRAAKAKILGWNATRIYGIDPITQPVGLSLDELVSARLEHSVPTRPWGPTTTTEEVKKFRLHHQGWP
jgi:hypothetical protein